MSNTMTSATGGSERSVLGLRIDGTDTFWHDGTDGLDGPDHSPSAFGISPGMEWRGDSRLIGWWTCGRADSRLLYSPLKWLLPQQISGLVWMASWFQELWGSPHCCFSFMVTRDKHTVLTSALMSIWFWKEQKSSMQCLTWWNFTELLEKN